MQLWRAGTFHERAQYFLRMWICGYGEIVTFSPRGLASNLHGPDVTNTMVHLLVVTLQYPLSCTS